MLRRGRATSPKAGAVYAGRSAPSGTTAILTERSPEAYG